MTYLLDTNSCIEFLRRGPSSSLAQRMMAAAPSDLTLCSVVVAELHFGAHRSARPIQTLAQVKAFCTRFRSFPFDDAAAEVYGKLRAALTTQGNIIGPNDLMIASIAIVHDLALVTSNTAEFSRVAGISIENWAQP